MNPLATTAPMGGAIARSALPSGAQTAPLPPSPSHAAGCGANGGAW